MSAMDAITAAVRDSGYTQQRVADLLGVSRPAVADRMRGRTRWTVEDVARLSRELGLTPDELIPVTR